MSLSSELENIKKIHFESKVDFHANSKIIKLLKATDKSINQRIAFLKNIELNNEKQHSFVLLKSAKSKLKFLLKNLKLSDDEIDEKIDEVINDIKSFEQINIDSKRSFVNKVQDNDIEEYKYLDVPKIKISNLVANKNEVPKSIINATKFIKKGDIKTALEYLDEYYLNNKKDPNNISLLKNRFFRYIDKVSAGLKKEDEIFETQISKNIIDLIGDIKKNYK